MPKVQPILSFPMKQLLRQNVYYNHFWDTPPSFDASNDRGALSANVIKTAEVCFLSAAQDVMKEAIYLDNMVFEINLRLKNDLTYIILRKYT